LIYLKKKKLIKNKKVDFSKRFYGVSLIRDLSISING